jgi:hypothetical protein
MAPGRTEGITKWDYDFLEIFIGAFTIPNHLHFTPNLLPILWLPKAANLEFLVMKSIVKND